MAIADSKEKTCQTIAPLYGLTYMFCVQVYRVYIVYCKLYFYLKSSFAIRFYSFLSYLTVRILVSGIFSRLYCIEYMENFLVFEPTSENKSTTFFTGLTSCWWFCVTTNRWFFLYIPLVDNIWSTLVNNISWWVKSLSTENFVCVQSNCG